MTRPRRKSSGRTPAEAAVTARPSPRRGGVGTSEEETDCSQQDQRADLAHFQDDQRRQEAEAQGPRQPAQTVGSAVETPESIGAEENHHEMNDQPEQAAEAIRQQAPGNKQRQDPG